MRIPIPIVIILCITTVVIVWILGTRDKNFTTPPTPKELVELTKEWEESRPNIAPPKPITTGSTDKRATSTPQTPIAPPEPKPEKLPTGNLLHAPGLSEYGTLGDKGGTAMVQLATDLETKGEFQRALLAWERVIDTSNPSPDERKQAVTAIKRLKSTLPPWNLDPNAEIKLILHAGATLKDKKALEDALRSAAELISSASGNLLQVDTKASIGKSRGTRTPRIPIAIWFSRPAPKASEPPAQTPPISFMADPSQQDMLADQISAGVYSLLRAHMASETSFSPLPEYPTGVQPNELIQHHITRLMWREFVNSMKE